MPTAARLRRGAGHCWAGSLEGSAPRTALTASLGISPELCARGGRQHSGPRCCPVPVLSFGVAPSGRRCIQSG